MTWVPTRLRLPARLALLCRRLVSGFSLRRARRGVTGRQAARAPRRGTAAGRLRPALDQVKKV